MTSALNNGFIAIHKQQDWTSHDVVAKLRGILGTKKIGHTGTLDPLATGVLVCAVGQATKLVEYMQGCDKEYIATFELGKTSDTYDSTGELRIESSELRIHLEDIQKVIQKYIGKIEQIPPAFSAIKIQGKKAYELARKGKKVDMPKRIVEIQLFDIISYEYPFLKVRIMCSGGTYIRSLAHDIGQDLGVGAIMTALERTRVGKFRLQDSVFLEEVNSKYLIWNANICNLPSVELSDNQLIDLQQGKYISLDCRHDRVMLGIQNTIPKVILESREDLWKTRKMLLIDN